MLHIIKLVNSVCSFRSALELLSSNNCVYFFFNSISFVSDFVFFATQYGIVKDRISIVISTHKLAGSVLLGWRSAVRDIFSNP